MKTKLLLIEDDPAIQKGIKEMLEIENYDIIISSDGNAGFDLALQKTADLILLDINLPGMSGLEICKNLRMKNISTPIIMLTARSEEADKVLGLELGADDYVTKPFGVKELIARIKAVMRRKHSIEEDFSTYSFSDVKIDFKKMETTKGETKIKLSLKEYELLKYFIKNTGDVISRNTLLDEIWGYEVFPTTRTVDNYILMLRKKIETNPSTPKHLLTMHSSGYKFVT
ncbi:MAG: response regulator transcription factor [bacterium]|nr:response regulator transcription factor [bacterium]